MDSVQDSQSFGARLRQRREERQVDLIAVAEQTKIKLSLLEALERDDVSQWPSGIFRRAYIRTYAHIIGLDPDVVLREFLEAHPDPPEMFTATTAAAAAAEEAARKNAAPSTRLRGIVDSALGSLSRLRRTGDETSGSAGQSPPDPSTALSGRTDAATQPAEEQALVAAGTGAAPGGEDGGGSAAERHAEPVMDAPAGGDAPRVAADADRTEQEKTSAVALPVHPSIESRLEEVAHLCTEFGRVAGREEVRVLLQQASAILDATGVIVWLWDDIAEELRPVLVHGYSDKVLAHLPPVRRDGDNATAAAFRSAATCAVAPTANATGALVVPLLIPEGCAGVLAVELQPGVQAAGPVRAIATILAAALTQLVHRDLPAVRHAPTDPTVPPSGRYGLPLRPAKVRR